MKTLRRLCATFVLTLALSLFAFAGNMPAGVTAPPPPDSQATTTGDISTSVAGDMATGVTATDPAIDALLTLLQSLLSLF